MLMMSPEELRQKVEGLLKRADAVNKRKASLSGQLEAKKTELANLVDEIRAAGYDPKNIVAERDRVQQELEAQVAAFEQNLVAAETAITQFERK